MELKSIPGLKSVPSTVELNLPPVANEKWAREQFGTRDMYILNITLLFLPKDQMFFPLPLLENSKQKNSYPLTDGETSSP